MKELRLSNVSKAFGNVIAVDNLTLEVERGSFFTLLGPSGCGKTTTLRIVAGLTKPDKGELYIDGVDSTRTPPYLRNVGVVFQNYALFPHMTVFENISFGLKIRNVPTQEIRQLVDDVIQLANLSGLEGRFPNQLSGGQQQRVAVARAIVIKPSILLLDEPLSNLDLKVRVAMRREVRNLTKRLGITTLNVTHDQGEALSMSDKIGIMNNGRVMQEGTPKEIYEHPGSQFVASFIGEINFIKGTVLEIEQAYASIKVGNAVTIMAKLEPQMGVPPKIRSEITVSVRPEKVILSRDRSAKDENVFPCSVEDMEYFGSLVRYIVRVGEQRWTCEVPNDRASAFEPGQNGFMSFSPQDCIISYQPEDNVE